MWGFLFGWPLVSLSHLFGWPGGFYILVWFIANELLTVLRPHSPHPVGPFVAALPCWWSGRSSPLSWCPASRSSSSSSWIRCAIATGKSCWSAPEVFAWRWCTTSARCLATPCRAQVADQLARQQMEGPIVTVILSFGVCRPADGAHSSARARVPLHWSPPVWSALLTFCS